MVTVVEERRVLKRPLAFGRRTQPRYRLPVVFLRVFVEKWRQRHGQEPAQSRCIALVHPPQFNQSLAALLVPAHPHARLTQLVVDLPVPLRRQPVFRHIGRLQTQCLRQIHQRVPRHGEGQLRLTRAVFLYAGDQQGAGIQNRCQCAQPALAGVLRAKKAQQRIRNMALQQFRRPPLPLLQQQNQGRSPTLE